MVASGRTAFRSAGTKLIHLRLTTAGKHLLERATDLRLIAEGTFTPSGGKPVSVTKAFVVKRQ